MDNLPIPKLRSSWVAALVNTILIFILYYVCLFDPFLIGLYRNGFDVINFEKKGGLVVWASIPDYSHPASPTSAYIYVRNIQDTPIGKTHVQLITVQDDLEPYVPKVLPQKLHDEMVLELGSEISLLGPHSTAIIRVPLIIQSKETIDAVLITKTEVATNFTESDPANVNLKATDKADIDISYKALTHNFIENILLPPWSNGFIFGLVLFSAYLARKEYDDMEQDEPDPFTDEWWGLTWTSLWKSFSILVACFALLGVFILDLFVGIVFVIAIIVVKAKVLTERNVVSSVLETITTFVERVNWETIRKAISIFGLLTAAIGATAIFFMEKWMPWGIVLSVGIVFFVLGLLPSRQR